MGKKIGIGTKLGYGIGDLGCNLVYTTAGSFLTLYYTDSVLLSAAFVGTMMLLVRILDGISDIVMGVVIDHTHSRFGKARPYVLFGSIFLVISFLLLFNVPSSLSTGGKEIYAVLTYIFMAVICYTAVNLAYTTLITLMTPDQGERASLSSVRMFFSFLAVMLINSITASLVSNFGGGQAGYSKVAMIYGAIAFVCILLSGIVGKENQAADLAADDMVEKEHIPAGEAVKALFSCKYTYICAFAFILNWMLIVLNGASTVFYARDVLGNIGLMAPLSIVGTVPSLILLILVPKIVRKWGTQKVMVIGAVIDVIAFIFPLLSPTSFSWY